MSRSERDLNRLFYDMANQSTPPESADDRARRRQRAIGGMRTLQRQSKPARARTGLRRRYAVLSLVAAAAVLGGSALAGAGGWLHFGALEPLRRSPPARVSRAPSRAPAPTSATLSSGAAAAVPETTAEAVAAPPTPAAAPPTPVAPSAGPKTSTDLEQINRLFAEAKRARREHRDAEALALLQRLLSEHPGSVLAPEAAVERFRALARLGRSADAAHYASAYLARYPSGYAAEEAQRIVDGAVP